MHSHPYQDQYFSILGDSLSTLEGYSLPEHAAYYGTAYCPEPGILVPSDTWWGQVIEALGGRLLVNHAIAGSTVCRHPRYEVPSYGCSAERTSALHRDGQMPDIILVFMGYNDWGMGVRILPEGEEDLFSFSYAYRQMLTHLRQNYPRAALWCFTLPVTRCTRRADFVFPYRYRGVHIEEYCRVIRDCAATFGARLIDLYPTTDPHDTVDGFHPTTEGMQTLARSILSRL